MSNKLFFRQHISTERTHLMVTECTVVKQGYKMWRHDIYQNTERM